MVDEEVRLINDAARWHNRAAEAEVALVEAEKAIALADRYFREDGYDERSEPRKTLRSWLIAHGAQGNGEGTKR